MHKLPKPEISFEDFFYNHLFKINHEIPSNFKSMFSLINSAAIEYNTKAHACELFKLKPICSQKLFPITPEDLKKLYIKKISRKGASAREFYDKLLAGSKKHSCCYCSQGEPVQLDHFLPQSNFPEFSILPINLVPICSRCNLLKSTTVPAFPNKCYVHPYYEDYSNIQWLVAELKFENNVPIATFKVDNKFKDAHPILFEKINYQFDKLELNSRYSAHANAKIAEIYHRLKDLRKISACTVKDHLVDEAKYSEIYNPNSWLSALYNMLSKSTQFCEVSWTVF